MIRRAGNYLHLSLPSLLPLSLKIDKAPINSLNSTSLSLFVSKIEITRSNKGLTR